MMSSFEDILRTVGSEVQEVLQNVNTAALAYAAEQLNSGRRMFVMGEGRSGLAGKMFAMRLMHGGYDVYAAGETITPAIQENDLLIVLSGSGKTPGLVHAAEKAVDSGASLLVFTTDPGSPLGKLSEGNVKIPAATKYRREEEPDTIQPLGNQFDQSLHLMLDALIIYAQEQNGSEDNDAFFARHSNLE
ncbi:6-phospho-3-hexuloisomerase [Salibacterium qingdaonense]|uniref:6-phospho-3-hexuloisomerase n=1 Tax=Salibacterium qingdaonense TaxID=266892 RepID=A0A1I4LD71_9BACI|nr:6-phospho-3-hexuloisomerase [Salibacterium qingdaonense]SFL88954.1 6-phospho-3-hexuloisomerase [Salibacterium qingdaonense]